MIERAERLHRQFFQPALDAIEVAKWEPPVDILETERELWIVAALPGVEPEDLDVSLGLDGLAEKPSARDRDRRQERAEHNQPGEHLNERHSRRRAG